ncbi:MAG: peptidoglycan editing factor PgeF [Clostridium sp.]|nr:peptidoglycan editing factor PgeF [Clostridium sp.]
MEFLNYRMGEGVRAFSTLRHGGYSTGTYTSFNVNAYCGDDPENVYRNEALLCGELGIDRTRLVMPHQTHGERVLRVDEAFLSSGMDVRSALSEGVDAVMTDVSRVCVAVSTADCIPVLLYDRRMRVVAAVHAGWRGTVAHIVEKTLRTMSETYATRSEDVCAVIGPGISLDAFEVGDEVYDGFFCAGFPMDRIAYRYPATGQAVGEKWHLDLWEANRWCLRSAGVREDRIMEARICTYARHHDFFSARRLGVCSGRILNGIFLSD